MAASADLYETLEISYAPPRARGDPPHPRGCPLCLLALGTGVLLVLGAVLAALGTLYVQGQAELRAVRAELAATTDLLRPDPDGPRSSGDTPAGVQRRQDQLGRWLQGLALGWQYHGGKIYLFSGEGRPWAAAEASCRATHAHLASVTSPEEQAYLSRESRGGTYWIGLSATGPGGTWRWVDGTPYSLATSFWAVGQPDSTDHGQWGAEDCAQIHPVGNGLWNDHNCNFSFPWICERDLRAP